MTNLYPLPELSPEMLNDLEEILKGLTASFLEQLDKTGKDRMFGRIGLNLLYYSGNILMEKPKESFSNLEYMLCYDLMRHVQNVSDRTGVKPPVWNEELFRILGEWVPLAIDSARPMATC